MGCSESASSSIEIEVLLNKPIFKTNKTLVRSPLHVFLRDFCKGVLQSNLNSSYSDKSIAFKITCNGKQYSINDFIRLHDLDLKFQPSIAIEGSLLDSQTIELTLIFISKNPKQVTLEVNKSWVVKSIVSNPDSKVILGDLELDHNERIENYDIVNRTKLYVLEDSNCNEIVQLWKIKKSGLVLEALCMNCGCMAYRQRICINLGLGEFDLQGIVSCDNERNCPFCNNALGNIGRIGYAHCIVTYETQNSAGCCRNIIEKTSGYAEYKPRNSPSHITVSKYL
jgi:hypothetical protein